MVLVFLPLLRVIMTQSKIIPLLILVVLGLGLIDGVTANPNSACADNCKFGDCPESCDSVMWECKVEDTINYNNSISSISYCVHKDLDSFNWRNIVLTFLISIISILASVVGIGGGGVMIPIYMLVGDFRTYYAIPLTVITIIGNSLVRMLILFSKKHPFSKNRYIIDYGVLLLIIPFDGNTSFVGFILNEIAPKWLVMSGVIIILSIISIKTIRKGVKELKSTLYKDEEKKSKIIVIDGISIPIFTTTTIDIDGIELNLESQEYNDAINNISEVKSIDRYKYMGVLALIFSILSGFTVTRKTIIEKCSDGYWIQYAGQFILMLGIGVIMALYTLRKYRRKIKEKFRFLQGDIEWNKKKIAAYTIISSMTGIISTFLGIGGGMLIAPFLIHIGMIPEVAAATNSISTFFSAMASTSQYIGSDRILISYSVYFFVLSAFTSYLGLRLASVIIKRFNRAYIVILLGVMVITSTLLMAVVGVNEIKDSEGHGFKSFC